MQNAPETPVVLLVEDRPDDVLLVKRSFERARIRSSFFVLGNGDEAIAYLNGEGKFSQRSEFPLPDLMLLDLKLPGRDGFEVLQWIRSQPSMKALRVIVLTSSEQIRDVNTAYHLGANSFLVKPFDFDNLVEMSRFICGYWLGMDRAPAISREPPELERREHVSRSAALGE